MKTIREALISMGYNEVKTGRWFKPISYQMFSYFEKTNEWSNWFYSVKGEIAVWETKTLDKNLEPLQQLKHFETFTRTNIHTNFNSQFEIICYDL